MNECFYNNYILFTLFNYYYKDNLIILIGSEIQTSKHHSNDLRFTILMFVAVTT